MSDDDRPPDQSGRDSAPDGAPDGVPERVPGGVPPAPGWPAGDSRLWHAGTPEPVAPGLWAAPGAAADPRLAAGRSAWPPPGGAPPRWPGPPPPSAPAGWPPLGGPPDPWAPPPPGWWEVPPHHSGRWRRMQIIALSAVVVIVAAIGVAVGRTSINGQPPGGGSPFGVPSGSSGGGPTPAVAPNMALITSKVDPGVVDVTTRLGFANGAAAGTGMVLAASGEILTNNHVIAGATSIDVTDVGNGRTYKATVVGTDKGDDVAVLQLSGASGLRTVTLGDSATLGVGQTVTAVGNAGGRGGVPSVAAGTITALDQPITAVDASDNSREQLTGLVQTDAALQPGDSGGPLVNPQGDVVGIDTAAAAGFQLQAGSSEGFAIPIDTAVSIARQMEAGVSSAKVHIGPAAFLGVEVEAAAATTGALVSVVEPGSPAERAGLVDGDVIVNLGGAEVSSPTALTNAMQRHHPGDRVAVTWDDQNGQQNSASVVLATGPAA